MLLLGIDLGTSSIKVAVVDPATQRTLVTATYPDTEATIITREPGWAEQSPLVWWEYVQEAVKRAHAAGKYDPKEIGAIGIAYQMHGLVVVDKQQQVLRDSIIWCDSRAVPYGEAAMAAIGEKKCLSSLLNSPGNFTAAKLAWVKDMEPAIFEKIDKILLPGDYIALQLTGEMTTSVPALSEGIFWDFQQDALSAELFHYFGFDKGLIPDVRPVFSAHGGLKPDVAQALSLKKGIPVTYKAGDQPNNALSLNVLEPGDIAATAGTSGVIYGVTDQLVYDPASRVNSFAHVNYSDEQKRIGVLLCINGTGILNRWIRDLANGGAGTVMNTGGDAAAGESVAGGKRGEAGMTAGSKAGDRMETFMSAGMNAGHAHLSATNAGGWDYPRLNVEAAAIRPGSEGLSILPFGNGAERILNNRIIGAQIHGIDLNQHHAGHLYRAGQEGIAFAFRYGLDIMRENGMNPAVIRAGRANMFLSPVFTEAFVNATQTPVELYESDGSVGAALGAGIGAGIFAGGKEAFAGRKPLQRIEPDKAAEYDGLYGRWKEILNKYL